MSIPAAIQTTHLSKRYALGPKRAGTAREAIAGTWARWRKAVLSRQPRSDSEDCIWALDDVSFEIERGAIVGIIGRNGAGKSTLLKILSRITSPTRGRATIAGRVGSLLEVGTGFHQDLTGRENIYLNGAILGIRKADIDRMLGEILAFAEVERFADTPVKHYSSGMYMRLAFAVAAHLDAEILVVDEVLAVGDSQFQKKCLGKMDAIARDGRTVLFVSHNMEAIQRLCTVGMYLDKGRLVALGPVEQVVSQYRAVERSAIDIGRFNARTRTGTGWARITDMVLVDDRGGRVTGVPAEVDLVFEVQLEMVDGRGGGGSLRGLVLELVIASDQGQPLLSLMNVDDGGVDLPGARSCRVRARLAAPTFIPGRYRVSAILGIPFQQHVDEIPDALEFDILTPDRPWRPYELHVNRGIVCRRATWQCGVTDSRQTRLVPV